MTHIHRAYDTETLFSCQECGRTFDDADAAEAVEEGCPDCSGHDIDLSQPQPLRDRCESNPRGEGFPTLG